MLTIKTRPASVTGEGMYYIHLHSNHGHLYVQLPGSTQWVRWSVEYAFDVLSDIQESNAQKILTKDLPEEITETHDYDQIWSSIRDVYKLNNPQPRR